MSPSVIERSLVMSKGEGLGHEAGVGVKEKGTGIA